MRIVAGTIAMLLIVILPGSALGLLSTAAASSAYASPQFATALLGLVAAAIGGLIAKRGWFTLVALATYAALWASAIYHVHRFPHGLTYASLVASNVVPIAISLSTACVGAWLGHKLSTMAGRRGET